MIAQEPRYKARSFYCPFCGVNSQITWSSQVNFAYYRQEGNKNIGYNQPIPQADWAKCETCGKYSLWIENKLVYPTSIVGPLPNDDLPDNLKDLYNEANSIATQSPRGAAALLRLVLQGLMKEAGEPGKNINDDIKSLVKKKRLLPETQKAVDSVRIIGNNAVHPGEIDLTDTPAIAYRMFYLINAICDRLISEPKQIKEIWEMMPDGAKKAVEKRDKKS